MIFTPGHAEVLAEIMRWRRDVRHFRPEPVLDENMAEIMAAMELSPSVGNSRPWRVMRVRSQALREGVIRSFDRCNASAAEAYPPADRAAYLELKLSGLREAPEHLAIFTQDDPEEGRGLGRQTMPKMLEYSTVMAVFSAWLAARAHNIGMGWVSILDEAEICRLLNAPQDWCLTAYLCMGYPEFNDDMPLLHRAEWQANTAKRWIER
jgi:5,6-dimethylbenzimidazole synthase